MRLKYLFTLLLFLMSHLALADLLCKFTSPDLDSEKFEHHWIFNDKTLICDKPLINLIKNQFETHPFSELMVIRGNTAEIDPAEFMAIDHSAGYSLVLKRIPNPKQTDKHLTYIPLTHFQSIDSFNTTVKSGSPNVLQLVNLVDADRWLADIVTLSGWSRRTGETGNDSAANWIAAQFKLMNLQVSQPSFQVGQNTTQNIMGIQLGQTRPDDWYLVGGHMDSVPTGNAPGAVDNASGCAAVIEMARVLSQFKFAGTLIFICYSGEEQGLIGSEFHADTLINEGNDSKIKLALTLDMVGYTSNSKHQLLIESSATYQNLMNEMAQNAAIYAPGLTVLTTTNYFGSDHVSYINNGMPGLLSIDVDWGVYPDYHQNTDLPENINLTQGEYIIKTNLATIADNATVIGLSDVIFASGFE
ncbi:M28 family metallopeptidase [Marinicella litoralis]|uniref:Peptidase M28-like protein n=1 Tax=Marinicella litoralis TaxID=644220 RepID=A0A4R6XS68_9GAMM|nr:M28 family metallopeptidase [Marinicella litoralis]TDR22772.1 peptidase M28-like protein [Marinicella litoralis]